MNEFHMPMGIKKPETATETQARSTVNGMRKAITDASYHSALIRQCMLRADAAGLSGEDRYVLIAYHALMMLEELHRDRMDRLMLEPNPLILPIRQSDT